MILKPFNNLAFISALLLQVLISITPAYATETPDEVPVDAAINEHLNEFIDLGLPFVDQNGETKALGEFFLEGRPLIVAPVYFECPRLCTLTQQGMVDVLKKLKLPVGEDFKVLSVSFNHKERVSQALAKADKYRGLLPSPHLPEQGWDFLIGSEENVTALMKSLGFSYKEDQGEFVHSAGFAVLTPKGKISRYFYGIQFKADDLRFALVEAAAGKIGSSFDKVLLYCFRFDPTKGKYTLAIWNVVRVVCSLFFLLLMGSLIALRAREKSSIRKAESRGNKEKEL